MPQQKGIHIHSKKKNYHPRHNGRARPAFVGWNNERTGHAIYAHFRVQLFMQTEKNNFQQQ